jgi:hypothetical protein
MGEGFGTPSTDHGADGLRIFDESQLFAVE